MAKGVEISKSALPVQDALFSGRELCFSVSDASEDEVVGKQAEELVEEVMVSPGLELIGKLELMLNGFPVNQEELMFQWFMTLQEQQVEADKQLNVARKYMRELEKELAEVQIQTLREKQLALERKKVAVEEEQCQASVEVYAEEDEERMHGDKARDLAVEEEQCQDEELVEEVMVSPGLELIGRLRSMLSDLRVNQEELMFQWFMTLQEQQVEVDKQLNYAQRYIHDMEEQLVKAQREWEQMKAAEAQDTLEVDFVDAWLTANEELSDGPDSTRLQQVEVKAAEAQDTLEVDFVDAWLTANEELSDGPDSTRLQQVEVKAAEAQDTFEKSVAAVEPEGRKKVGRRRRRRVKNNVNGDAVGEADLGIELDREVVQSTQSELGEENSEGQGLVEWLVAIGRDKAMGWWDAQLAEEEAEDNKWLGAWRLAEGMRGSNLLTGPQSDEMQDLVELLMPERFVKLSSKEKGQVWERVGEMKSLADELAKRTAEAERWNREWLKEERLEEMKLFNKKGLLRVEKFSDLTEEQQNQAIYLIDDAWVLILQRVKERLEKMGKVEEEMMSIDEITMLFRDRVNKRLKDLRQRGLELVKEEWLAAKQLADEQEKRQAEDLRAQIEAADRMAEELMREEEADGGHRQRKSQRKRRQ